MKKNDKKYPGIYLSSGSDENMSLLSSPSSSSSSSSSPNLPIENENAKNKNSANVNINGSQVETNAKANPPSPVFTVDEIVNCIIKCVKEAELYNSTYWDDMSKFVLKYTITNIHKQCENEYLKDLIVYKQYDTTCEIKTNVIKYGVFKHKCFNLMFRIDNSDDQFSGEDIVSSALMHKYHKYKDIIRLGIVIPVYCHIKLSNPQLFYSVQPYITNSITFDRWIKSIKHKSNFDEIVYDALIQLCGILKELHDVDCVHGDIKPSNILVIPNQTQVSIYLIDFGLSGIHEKKTSATGGTLPFCAPETYNTNANTRNGNDVIKYPQHFEYNWVKHKKSHDIWSLGFIFMTVYIFKHINLYYHEYPSDFFLPSGYVSPNYLRMVQHEYIRDMFMEHILVEPSKRCDILKLNDLISNLSFM